MFEKSNNFERASEDLSTVLSNLNKANNTAINNLSALLFIDPVYADKFSLTKAYADVKEELKKHGYDKEVSDEEIHTQLMNLFN